MSKNLLTVVIGVVWLAGQSATTPAVRVDAAQIFHDVETLAADDMEGRLPGSPGGEKARAYVLRRLKEAGVVPLGEGFERPFTFGELVSAQAAGDYAALRARGRRVFRVRPYDLAAYGV